MSVVLGEFRGMSGEPDIMVSASEYDADSLTIEQGEAVIEIPRKQLQELSIIVDRFMDR